MAIARSTCVGAILLVAFLLAGSSAVAQDFNVKCGEPPPSSAYGAASGQVGPWNVLSMGTGDLDLVDTNGRSTGATARAEDCDWGSCDDCGVTCPGFSGSPDDTALLSTWFNGDCIADVRLEVRSLVPGTYELHVYVYHGCNPSSVSNVDLRVKDADDNDVYNSFFQLGGAAFQGTWTGFPVGVRTFDVAPGQYVKVRWGSVFGGACGIQLNRLDEAGQAICPGDGSAGACPCANNGGTGRGCENSIATGGAVLYASGQASLSQDTLSFASSWERSTAFTLIFQGDASTNAVAFGDGLRCVDGNLKRLYAKPASFGFALAPVSGDPSVSARSTQLGDAIPSGGTRYYQAYYRDPNPSFCPAPQGSTFNSTTGLAIVWGG